MLTGLNVRLGISCRFTEILGTGLLCVGRIINRRMRVCCFVSICRIRGFFFGLRRLLGGRIGL